MSQTPPTPRPAATVVIARGEAPWEVLFLKRHGKSGFMANAYVFPGGRVDDADASESLIGRIEGLDLGALCELMDGIETPREAASYVVAAVRETFEEAGILLARDASGAMVSHEEAGRAARLAAWRDRLNAGDATFESVLEAENLVIAGDALRYFDHWVTPAREPRRYDARFFVVAAPDAQRGAHDGHETTESVWRTPSDALSDHDRGQFMLPPPTWRVMMDLRRWSERATMLDSVTPTTGVVRTEPRMLTEEGRFVLALPGDPDHVEPLARPYGGRRIVLDGGHWAER